jgi:hypothetical protein
MLARDAITPTNMNPIHEKAKKRVDRWASLSVFDHTKSGTPINIPTPVIEYTGTMSKSRVGRPRADAKATAWTAAIELKIMDAPRVLLTSHSVLWKTMLTMRSM